ncbi:dolichyl-diphosphooligosaccharide--protein glycosyltransferase subunit STT3B [Sarcoptes scabiei]|nr:dolichyl-diphosphooligosaccharide--protein glycosyltransferase subunit STT3B [Sarcoptes scabiei]
MDDCSEILNLDIDLKNRSNILSEKHRSDHDCNQNNLVYLSGHKNPFDRQFELALKNGITYNNLLSSSSSSLSNHSFLSNSPLNTPLIPPDSALTSNVVTANDPIICDPSPAITTAQITNLIIESELVKNQEFQTSAVPNSLLDDESTIISNTNSNIRSDAIISNVEIEPNSEKLFLDRLEKNPEKNDFIEKNTRTVDRNQDEIDNSLDRTVSKQTRSNVVSVICPPFPIVREKNSAIHSAPVILSGSSDVATKITSQSDRRLENLINRKHEAIAQNTNSFCGKNICPVTSSSEPYSLKYSELPSDTGGNLKKILPKQIFVIDSNSNDQDLSVSKKAYGSLSSTTRRKEKTLDELISKIKETEAALPPKAKPGRKSKTATIKEDVHERKRLSLERNRAAAMRCRLKKKKEIDALKLKVENFEQQNHQLRKIIDSLYNEVTLLKKELMGHKNCN